MDQRARALKYFANWKPGNPVRHGNQPMGDMGFVPRETYVARFLREHAECTDFRPELMENAKQRATYSDHVHVYADGWDEGAEDGEKCRRSL